MEDNMRQAYVHESREMLQFNGLLGEVNLKMTATRTHKAALRYDSRSLMGYPEENWELS